MDETLLKSALQKNWKENIAKLKAYKKRYGNFNVPTNWNEDSPFAKWVNNIRLQRQRLPADLRVALTKIGFTFDVPTDWETMFLQLESFFRKYGNSFVPPFLAEYENLFDWTERQRLSLSLLSNAQLKKLNSVNFEWARPTDKDLLWQQRYSDLLAFKAEHGHARVPSTWKNKQLAGWVSKQREGEKAMIPWRKRMLNEIGFFWYRDMQRLDEEAWQTKYDQLKEFYKTNKHFVVPTTKPEFHSLQLWVTKQRGSENNLPAHQKNLLDKIGFPWKHDIQAGKESDWLLMYGQLVSYYKKYGDSTVSSHSTNYPNLGSWVLRQRKNWKKLDKRQQALLRKVKFQTSEEIQDLKRGYWMRMFAELKRYKAANGDCRVPSNYPKNFKLGRWVEVQRLNESNLVEWKKKLLNSVHFDWSDDLTRMREEQWLKMYHQLERFYKRYGHSSVPYGWAKNKPLANWVMYQRDPKMPLSKDKKRLLKELSFSFSARPTKSRKRDSAGQFIVEV